MQIRHLLTGSSASVRGNSHRFINALILLSIAAGAGALSACADATSDAPFKTVFNPCEPLMVVAQPGTTPAELQSLDRAVTMWNTAAGLQLQRTDSTDAPPDLPQIPVYFKDGAPFMHGHYSDELGSVTLNHKLSARQHTITAAHELGHAFGLRHVTRESRPSLMNHGNLETEVTPKDVETLHALWPDCPHGEPDEDSLTH